MKQLFLIISLCSTIGLMAQKTISDANAVTRNAKNFHAIDISDGVDLYLTQGNEEAVAVSATENSDRDKIRTEVVNGVLKIYYNREGGWRMNWGNRKLKAYVSVKTIDQLHASGGADVFVDEALNVTKLSMHFSGGSDFRGKLEVKTLSVQVSGGSDAYISGTTDDLKISASGGSDIHAFELSANNCTIESSGGSDVRITANKQINANASGGSDVYYKGTASSNTNKSGGGSIKKVS